MSEYLLWYTRVSNLSDGPMNPLITLPESIFFGNNLALSQSPGERHFAY